MPIANLNSGSVIGQGLYNPVNGDMDEVLNNGSLILIDAAHSLLPSADRTVLPLQGSTPTIENLAWKSAATLTGGTQSTLRAPFASNFLSSDLVFERASKNGIHGACSRSGMLDNRHAYLGYPDPVKTYILANPSHRYFFALEGMVTRKALYVSSNTLPFSYVASSSSSTINAIHIMNGGDDSGTERGTNSYAELGSLITPGPNTEAVSFLRTAGTWRWQNSAPGDISNLQAVIALWGAYGVWSSIAVNKAASWIFRRFYLEDLTVSGREYQEAEDAVKAIWQRETAVGGRWYNETYTAPATLRS